MSEVHVLTNRTASYEESWDPEVEVTSYHWSLLEIHRSRRSELSPGSSYAERPWKSKRDSEGILQGFTLPEGVAQAHVVYLTYTNYETFSTQSGLIQVVDVLPHEEDALDLTAALERHFNQTSPIVFKWGPKAYSFFSLDDVRVSCEKLDVLP